MNLQDLEKRVAELERLVELLAGHIHIVDEGDTETTPALVEGENNEGQEIWKPLSTEVK